jgi:hypothetical protein
VEVIQPDFSTQKKEVKMNSLQQAHMVYQISFSIVGSMILLSLMAITWYLVTHKDNE